MAKPPGAQTSVLDSQGGLWSLDGGGGGASVGKAWLAIGSCKSCLALKPNPGHIPSGPHQPPGSTPAASVPLGLVTHSESLDWASLSANHDLSPKKSLCFSVADADVPGWAAHSKGSFIWALHLWLQNPQFSLSFLQSDPDILVSMCSPSSFLISALLPQILPSPQLPFCLPTLFPFSHLHSQYLPSPAFSLTFSLSPHLFLISCPFCLSPSPPPSVSLSSPSLPHPPISPFLVGVDSLDLWNQERRGKQIWETEPPLPF